MNKLELKQVLEEGEGYKIEFKEALDKEMAAGGRIFIGVRDAKTLTRSAVSSKVASGNTDPKTDPKTDPETTPKATPKTTPKTEAAILALIQANPRLTKADLAKELNITVDGIKYSIKKLTKSGVLRWHGPSKTGQWKLNVKR